MPGIPITARLPRASWTQRLVAFQKCTWDLLLILIVLGRRSAGLFTPTEAAAISAGRYAFVIAVFVYKDMGLQDVPGAARLANVDADDSQHHHQCGVLSF